MLTEKKPREPALPLLIPPVILQPARPGLTESFYFFRVQLAYIFQNLLFIYIYIYSPCQRKKKQQLPIMGAAGCKLPSNVTRTRGKNVKRFGVKIRFNGFSLRIGSAYCTAEDASAVASAFRKVAFINKDGEIDFILVFTPIMAMLQ